ncbi:MAG TPA: undecaprenyl-diphosphate phosphatase [Solirubrobacteraceae bacterium]|jgi:undecaprenyl-diphosphatase|nr:undecaprenyl-diphosphate phosphatase [Solirubrobacteraceae bacterium]
MQPAEQSLPLRHAVALGVLHGPTELLPISSSAHTTLLPWLLDWPYARLDGQQRKAFEVALHAGAGAALAIHLRRELVGELSGLDARRLVVIALALAPPALVGYALERPIARRLGGPRSIAAGLGAGAVAMALADGRRRTGADRPQRDVHDARPFDGLALGLAQATALIPGVSRNGATLTAARARGFSSAAAQRLSWHAGLPVIAGAAALEAAHTRSADVPREQRLAQLAGAVSAFATTLAVARVLRRQLRDGQPLWPYALYRAALAALVVPRSSAQ